MESDLRRALSTVYYALFHGLAQCCADEFIGRNMRRSTAWKRAYRALNHGQAAEACRGQEIRSLPVEVRDFAQLFVALQSERHRADYDPDAVLFKSDVHRRIADARAILDAFQKAGRGRRSLAALAMFRRRN